MRKKVLLVEGGIGKQIALTGVVCEYAKRLGETVIVISPHDYIWWGLPGIEVYNVGHPHLYEHVIRPNDLIRLEPYHCPKTYRDEWHIISSSAHILSIIEPSSQNEPDVEKEGFLPRIALSVYEQNEAWAFKQRPENRDGFILFQPFGASHGQFGDHTSRSMPAEFAQQVAHELAKIGKVYQVSSPGIAPLDGCVVFSPETTTRQIMSVAQYASCIVAIDSFLQHACAAIKKRAIVIWGSTSERVFGYSMHINIREHECPRFIPTSLPVNDPKIDERNKYSNQFTQKTLNEIFAALQKMNLKPKEQMEVDRV